MSGLKRKDYILRAALFFSGEFSRLEIAHEQCTVNIMIPYQYAGFLFANSATFPKFVTGEGTTPVSQ